MEKKNAVYTITEDQSPEEARREHVMLVVRWRISTNCCAQRRIFSARARILLRSSS